MTAPPAAASPSAIPAVPAIRSRGRRRPCARRLINGVTERDIQDILDILLLNAKGGHLPTIKFLFAYVHRQAQAGRRTRHSSIFRRCSMLQQSALPPEALETLCDQLPLDFQVQLTRFSQAENAAAAVQTALDNEPAAAASAVNKRRLR